MTLFRLIPLFSLALNASAGPSRGPGYRGPSAFEGSILKTPDQAGWPRLTAASRYVPFVPMTIAEIRRNPAFFNPDSTAPRRKTSAWSTAGGEAFSVCREFVLGQAGGAVLGLFGLIGGAAVGRAGDSREHMDIMAYGGVIGYIVGNSYGVYAGGNDREHRGNFSSTLTGSLAGTAAGLAVFNRNYKRHSGALALWLGAPAGSLIGFHLSRKGRMTASVLPSGPAAFSVPRHGDPVHSPVPAGIGWNVIRLSYRLDGSD
jgi:hypothetical protein